MLESGTAPKIANVQLGYQAQTRREGDGTFKLEDVAPGKYDLTSAVPSSREFAKRDVEVKAGKPTDVGTLTVMRGRKVVGRVIDGKGNAVAGAKVKTGDMLYSMQGAEEQLGELARRCPAGRSARRDQDGRFTLIGIGKKATSVVADHPTRGRSNAVEIPDGTDDPPPITLALRGFGTITGKVTSKGKRVGGVDDHRDAEGRRRAGPDRADRGRWHVHAEQGDRRHAMCCRRCSKSSFGMSLKSTSTTVQVTAGKETKVTIDIPVGSLTLAVHRQAAAGQQGRLRADLLVPRQSSPSRTRRQLDRGLPRRRACRA